MSEKDYLITLFGKAAEVLVRMAALVHQIMKQGGQAEDINLLADPRVLARVAEVLARAGRLRRPFSVNNGVDGNKIDIYLIGMGTKNMSEIEQVLAITDCRLATHNELVALHHGNPGFLYYEEDLSIVGEKLEYDQAKNMHIRWVLSKNRGTHQELFADDAEIQGNYLFAVAFKESKKLKTLEEFLKGA